MSVEHSSVLAYGIILTNQECRDALKDHGLSYSSDEAAEDYVEEPEWDLSQHLGLQSQRIGSCYSSEEDAIKYVISAELVWSDDQATVRPVGVSLALLKSFCKKVARSPEWISETLVH